MGHVDVEGVSPQIAEYLPVLEHARNTLSKMLDDLSGPAKFGLKGMDIQIRKEL